jgi:hypothetical protein
MAKDVFGRRSGGARMRCRMIAGLHIRRCLLRRFPDAKTMEVIIAFGTEGKKVSDCIITFMMLMGIAYFFASFVDPIIGSCDNTFLMNKCGDIKNLTECGNVSHQDFPLFNDGLCVWNGNENGTFLSSVYF